MEVPSDIGEFVIGESPIGDQPFDWTQTLYAQYANSPILLYLLGCFSQCVSPNQLIDAFYDQIWNLNTAQGYGLDLWGRIVGIGRVLTISATPYQSFNESGGNAVPTPFSTLFTGGALTENYALSDDAFRLLIYAKAAANIWDGSIQGLNRILQILFPNQIAYVTDGQNMTMTYTFKWELTPVQLAIVSTSGVLPRPCGVSSSIVQIN